MSVLAISDEVSSVRPALVPRQAAASRIAGLDAARCIAIFGMTIVNYKNALQAHAGAPWWITGPFDCVDGRAAATFVTLAGIGAILLSRGARESGDPAQRAAARRRLFYRAMFILALGVLNFQVWPGDILHFYGLYMATGALLLFAKPSRLVIVAAAGIAAAHALDALFPTQGGYGPDRRWYLDYFTVEGFLRNEFLNGYHPYFPWIAYYLFGMWLGQQDLYSPARRQRFLIIAAAGIAVCEVGQAVWSASERVALAPYGPVRHILPPVVPGLLHMGSMMSSAVAVITVSLWIAETHPASRAVGALAATGKMALTHYLAHTTLVLGPLFIRDQLEEDHSRWTSLGLALAFCIAAVTFSNLWKKRYRYGPLEAIMRRICG